MILRRTPDGPALARIEVADSLWTRTRGLLGRDDLPEDHGLWIKRCTSVHTFFMRFDLDLVFVDRSLKIVKVYRNVPPRRLTRLVRGARDVIEFKAGFVSRMALQPGEQLHVDHPLS